MIELISIIVPIYKVEKYLNRCVDSILNQTYSNLEIILVDDGSPDKCGEICDEYSKIDDRVKVIHKENGGVSDARNAGIDIAKGEYLSFVDSDDWVHQEYIERMYELLKTSGSDMAVCNHLTLPQEGKETYITKKEVFEFSNLEALEHLLGKLSIQLVVAWGKLYHKSLFKEIKFPVGKNHEDQFTCYKLIYEAKKIILTREKLLYYWQRDDSFTASGFNFKDHFDFIEALEERLEFLKNIGDMELVAKTYRKLFGKYKIVRDKKHSFNEIEDEKEFESKFINLKNELRQSKQSKVFRIYYELYYKMPKTIMILHKIYMKIKRKY